jgi:hypothetical protein
LASAGPASKLSTPTTKRTEESEVKEKAPVIKQLYRLNVEPKVVDQLTRLASRTGEPKSRLATRLFTEAVMGFKPGPKKKPA